MNAYFATCPRGLEALLEGEITRCGGRNPTITPGGVVPVNRRPATATRNTTAARNRRPGQECVNQRRARIGPEPSACMMGDALQHTGVASHPRWWTALAARSTLGV